MSDRFDGAQPGDWVEVTSNARWEGRVGVLRGYEHRRAGFHGRSRGYASVDLDAVGRAKARTVVVTSVRQVYERRVRVGGADVTLGRIRPDAVIAGRITDAEARRLIP